jgi:hypothetical protein
MIVGPCLFLHGSHTFRFQQFGFRLRIAIITPLRLLLMLTLLRFVLYCTAAAIQSSEFSLKRDM